MKKINDGGSAYPARTYEATPDGTYIGEALHSGMTLRQWYAGQALAGLAGVFVKSSKSEGDIYDQVDMDYYAAGGAGESAEIAFALADAMIAHEQNEEAK